MTCVDEFKMALAIENTEKHGGVTPDLGVFAEERIDMVENARRIGAHPNARECALQHGG